MNARAAVTAFATLALCTPAAAHAQAQDSAQQMVPAEFVELLWGPASFGGRPELLIGSLPDELSSALTPGRDVRIVGSVVSRLFSLAAVVVPTDRDSARGMWDASLQAAGFRREERMRRPEGGFEQESEFTPSTIYCSADDRQLGLSTRRHRGDSTLVVFMMAGESNTGPPCGEDLPSSGMMMRMESPIPILRAPEGATQRGSGGGGGGDEWDSRTRLRTDLTPGALVAHYAPQFMEQGWQPVTQTLGDDVAIHVFRKTDDEGVAWHAVLYVTLLSNAERDLYLRVTAVNR